MRELSFRDRCTLVAIGLLAAALLLLVSLARADLYVCIGVHGQVIDCDPPLYEVLIEHEDLYTSCLQQWSAYTVGAAWLALSLQHGHPRTSVDAWSGQSAYQAGESWWSAHRTLTQGGRADGCAETLGLAERAARKGGLE